MTLLVYEKCKWKSSHPREGVVSCSIEDIGCPRHPHFSAKKNSLFLFFPSIGRSRLSFIITFSLLSLRDPRDPSRIVQGRVSSCIPSCQCLTQFLIGQKIFSPSSMTTAVISFRFNRGSSSTYFPIPLMERAT